MHTEQVLAELPLGARVAVIRLRSLGDCVLTTPALALLGRSRPDLQVAVVVEPRWAAVFEGNTDVKAILPPNLFTLWKWKPQLCLNLHGGTRSLQLTAVSRAPHRAGFAHLRDWGLHNHRIPRAQQILGEERPVHTAEHLASAVFHLGAERMPVPPAKLFAEKGTYGEIAVVHPFASQADKTWPPDRFVAAAGYLAGSGLEPVILGSSGDDFTPFGAYRKLQGAPLSGVKRLLASALLFLGNDSGPAHMAAAFGVPTLVLFGSSDPRVWAPWRVESQVLTGQAGIASIPVQQVMEAVGRLRVAS